MGAKTACELIDESIRDGGVARGAYSDELHHELCALGIEWLQRGVVRSYWGSRDGQRWAVRLEEA